MLLYCMNPEIALLLKLRMVGFSRFKFTLINFKLDGEEATRCLICCVYTKGHMSTWLIQRIKEMLLCIVYAILFVNTVNMKIKAHNALNGMFVDTVEDTGVCGSYTSPVYSSGGFRGRIRRATAPTAQNLLDFMQFFGKFDKIICWRPLEGRRPLLQGILDPPLYRVMRCENSTLLAPPTGKGTPTVKSINIVFV